MNAMWNGALGFVGAMSLMCAPCVAQPDPVGQGAHVAVVTAIGLGLEPHSNTERVRVLKFADFSTQRSLSVHQKLFEGDMLDGGSEELRIELQCSLGSRVKLSGIFRIAINSRRDGQDCALSLMAGSVDVITDQKTEINAGGRIMGSVGTHYAVSALHRGTVPVINLEVFEGAIDLRGRGQVVRIEQMNTVALQYSGAEPQPVAIAPSRYRQQARLLAEFDTLKAQVSSGQGGRALDPQTTFDQLLPLNEAVLKAPDDPSARLRLATAQSEMKLSGEARFNLQRLDVGQGTVEQFLLDTGQRRGLEVPAVDDERIRRQLRALPELQRAVDRFDARQRVQQFDR